MSGSVDRVLIKICGLTCEGDVHAAADAGAHLVGFVLAPQSPRVIPIERACSLAEIAHTRGLDSVALVVDPTPEAIRELGHFTRIQCHGAEACSLLALAPRPTIKGFAFSPDSFATWNTCAHAHWLIVDSHRGGSGECFDHAALAPLVPLATKPLLLAGGLTPENVGAAIERVRPNGVDVSSGVERARGVKDHTRIADFCRAVRSVSA